MLKKFNIFLTSSVYAYYSLNSVEFGCRIRKEALHPFTRIWRTRTILEYTIIGYAGTITHFQAKGHKNTNTTIHEMFEFCCDFWWVKTCFFGDEIFGFFLSEGECLFKGHLKMNFIPDYMAYLWQMPFESEVDQIILAHESFFFFNRENSFSAIGSIAISV